MVDFATAQLALRSGRKVRLPHQSMGSYFALKDDNLMEHSAKHGTSEPAMLYWDQTISQDWEVMPEATAS